MTKTTHIGATTPPYEEMDPVYVSTEQREGYDPTIEIEVGDIADPHFQLSLREDEARQLIRLIAGGLHILHTDHAIQPTALAEFQMGD